MDIKIAEIVEYIEKSLMTDSQEPWDNSGIQIGSKNSSVEKILLCMDITDKNVDFAVENNIDLILSHHPLFFDSIKSISSDDYKGKLIYKSIKNNLNIYSMHTDLDKAKFGVNYEIAEILGLKIEKPLIEYDDGSSMGIISKTSVTKEEILERIKEKITSKSFKLYGKDKEKISKIALLGGSGMFAFENVIKNGCDLFITSDVKYHDGQKAYENDILLVDINHFFMEKVILKSLKLKIQQKFENLEIFISKENPFLIED